MTEITGAGSSGAFSAPLGMISRQIAEEEIACASFHHELHPAGGGAQATFFREADHGRRPEAL